MTERRGSSDRGGWLGWAVLFGIAGLGLGSLFEQELAGLGLGLLVAVVQALGGQIRSLYLEVGTLEERLAQLERQGQIAAAARADAPRSEASDSGPSPEPVRTPPAATAAPSADARPPTRATLPPAAARPTRIAPPQGPPRLPPTPARSASFDAALGWLRAFFFSGNTVVRVGVLVLLVGVVLLAKWAAERSLFPIELRLALAAGLGLALTGLGYRLRERRPGFAASLEGGGIAALYLVIFFAYRTYELVPAALAFALFVGLAASSGVLAVLQRSQPLMVIGSLGGFLAPIAASSGGGSHVGLFSYYLLLDVGIALVVWIRSWRALLALSFVCTYGVATLFGVLSYDAADFATTQPFVIAFLVLFSAQAVTFARQGVTQDASSPRVPGYVDGTLVFGTPLVTLLLQARLASDFEFGLAYSAAALGLYYALLARGLYRSAREAHRPLFEAFAALAVGFATMAIPFAVDDAFTTAIAWSLEGAGIYWVGLRQARRLPRFAGLGLQLLAAFSFAAAGDLALDAVYVVNARFLSCLALAAAAAFIARTAWVQRDALPAHEGHRTQGLAVWGLLWWTAGVIAEVDTFGPVDGELSVLVAMIGVTVLGAEVGGARTGWLPGRLLALAGLPAGAFALLAMMSQEPHLFAHGGGLAWAFALGALAFALQRLERAPLTWLPQAWAPWLWLLALVGALGLHGMAARGVPDTFGLALGSDWRRAGFGLGLALVLSATCAGVRRPLGPLARNPEMWLGPGAGPLVGAALAWLVSVHAIASGDANPLPYVPLLNPIDVALAGVAVTCALWWRTAEGVLPVLREPARIQLAALTAAALAFEWLNAILVRTVHQWTAIPFRAEALWDSAPLQVALSISWTLVALGAMLHAHRIRHRGVWIGAASLLGAVVLKLFTVDLAQLGTPARIGTFLVVGVLLMLVGYVSPVPPPRDTAVEGGRP